MQDAIVVEERSEQRPPRSDMNPGCGRTGRTRSGISDEELFPKCLDGDEKAWATLVAKYQNLIFSIALRQGISKDDADDIRQDVFLTLLKKLRDLRNPRALGAWLIKTTCHECVHWHRKPSQLLRTLKRIEESTGSAQTISESAGEAHELEGEQKLPEAIAQLPTRCRELIQMLFFTSPPPSYEEVANRFGLATGSIGFIRMRCLQRLRQRLEAEGL